MYLLAGMHRSGTSLVARLAHEAGADMGDPATFYRPDRWNPEGYFEQPDIHAINMPLIDGPWGRLAYFYPPSTSTILRRAERMEERIAQAAARYRGKVVKENRFCLTLPAWRAHGADVRAILVCLREPVQVARSLRARNHISLRRGLGLWRVHLERLLAHAADLPLTFVRYEALLDPGRQGGELERVLGFCRVECSPSASEELLRAFARPDMDHRSEIAYEYPPAVASLWRRLEECYAAQRA